MAENVEKLIEVGGSRWQRAGRDRVYFNDLAGLYGLKCSYYNSGNISGAWLDGQEISNGRARSIATDLSGLKLWYDVTEDRFYSRWQFQPRFNADEYVSTIITRIRERVATLAQPA